MPSTPNTPGNVTQGSEVGDLCFSHELNRVDSTGVLEETIDPAKTGKLTIVNFWGTWCPGCVAELPYFDQIAEDYAGEVVVIAVHTSMIVETADEYIAENYPDSKILFASDYLTEGSNAEVYYTKLGGRGSYPYTVILDENGVIRQKIVATVTYEDLEQAIENAKQAG